MKEKINRSALLQVRLTLAEQSILREHFSKSTCRKLSDYARLKLFNKPIKIFTRNQSLDDFMSEMIRLRLELNFIGNNFNQAVKKLHSLDQTTEVKIWAQSSASMQQKLLDKVDEIKSKIIQINDQWLQS